MAVRDDAIDTDAPPLSLPSQTDGRRHTDRRAAVALVLAFAAVVAAVGAAIGPAVAERAMLTWPPPTLPSTTPTRTWLAPVLLARHTADTIDARLPCGDAATVRDAGRSVTVLATARGSAGWGGLDVTRSRATGETVIRVGHTQLARFAASSQSRACSIRLRFDGNAWTLDRPGHSSLSGVLQVAPNVFGLLTELDLRQRPSLQVTIEPIPQDVRASGRQTALRILAAALLVAAVAILLAPGIRTKVRRPRLPRLVAQDAVVSLVLVAWWLLAPLQDDDGWVRARESNYLVSGGFSNYFKEWGSNLPMAAWLEWLQHFVGAETSGLALLRLPSLFALLATWFVCRWCVALLTRTDPERRSLVWWSAALAFLVGATAFGMTLRAEPAIALLTVGVLACCLAYVRAPSVGPLVATVLLCGLAVTSYPSGVVSAAPILLCVPRIVSDARRRSGVSLPGLGSAALIGVAWVVLLEFLDSDIDNLRERLDLFEESGSHASSVSQELDRYLHLSDAGATPLRRLFVALLFLAVAALLVRLPRRPSLRSALPSASLAIALLLLAFTPSKWIWHFGGLLGVCAVAIAVEAQRVSSMLTTTRVRRIFMAAIVVIAIGAVSQAHSWGPLDTGRIDLNHVPAVFVAAIVLVLGAVALAARLGRIRRPEAVVLPASLATVLVVTLVLFAADAVATDGWTAARQSISSLVGRDGCGAASDTEIALADPGRSTSAIRLAPGAATPWYPVSARPMGVFVRGPWNEGDALVVEWGVKTPSGAKALGSGSMDAGDLSPGRALARSRFVPDSAFPPRPRNADFVRFRSHPVFDTYMSVTPPVPYSWISLASVVGNSGTPSVVSPVLFAAMPCAALPVLSHGVAQPPAVLVDGNYGITVLNYSSPFVGLRTMLDVTRLPARSPAHQQPMDVYRVIVPPGDSIASAVEAGIE